MAIKRSVSGNSKRVKSKTTSEVKSERPSDVSLRLRLGGNIKYITKGKTTDQTYVFVGSNPVNVSSLDASEMLSRIAGENPCCGASGIQHVFEIMSN